MKKLKKLSKKKIRKVEEWLQDLPAAPQMFPCMGLYQVITELHFQGDYNLAIRLCDAIGDHILLDK